MTTRTSAREMPLAFPNVKSTKPRRTSSRFASRTSVRSACNIPHLPREGCDFSELGQDISHLYILRMSRAKCKIKLAVKCVEFQIDLYAFCIGFDGGVSRTQCILGVFNTAENAGREK